jgi:hypothetical protein
VFMIFKHANRWICSPRSRVKRRHRPATAGRLRRDRLPLPRLPNTPNNSYHSSTVSNRNVKFKEMCQLQEVQTQPDATWHNASPRYRSIKN